MNRLVEKYDKLIFKLWRFFLTFSAPVNMLGKSLHGKHLEISRKGLLVLQHLLLHASLTFVATLEGGLFLVRKNTVLVQTLLPGQVLGVVGLHASKFCGERGSSGRQLTGVELELKISQILLKSIVVQVDGLGSRHRGEESESDNLGEHAETDTIKTKCRLALPCKVNCQLNPFQIILRM